MGWRTGRPRSPCVPSPTLPWFDVVTAGFTKAPVTTMGGLRLVPDTTIDDVNVADAGILLLPGGERWERQVDKDVQALVQRFDAATIPIAAICGATLAVARAGVTRGRRHTSNGKTYLKKMVPE